MKQIKWFKRSKNKICLERRHWREEREARSTLESGARPARERPCRRRSLFLFVVVVPLRFFFAVLSTSALSDLCHCPHPLRWFGYGVTTRSSGGPRWRKWPNVQWWYFPGGGGFCRSTAAGSSFREESLLQIRLRRLSAMESGGYQRSALPFGIPMFFEKKLLA